VEPSPDAARPEPRERLDLRGTPCPLNFIRARLALEKLPAGAWLQVDLDAGEPERMVEEGLRRDGHRVDRGPLPVDAPGVRLLVCRHGG
jgi:TusA-related sulfurtransferase